MDSKNFQQSYIQSAENDQFIIGADVISYLTPFKYPLIMVDRIVKYNSNPLYLIAERYISANEPAFVGHFPNMKLWPGVFTLEGLRQTCFLLHILNELEEANLLKGLIELQNRQILRPQINHKLCRSVFDYLERKNTYDSDLYSTSMKFIEPVFAGSLITYSCMRDENDLHCWSVKALVDDRLIAKGRIIQSFNINS
jgi:3-hydroxymyristoyl/3-hydroxydecanoyl-(acyl carrier protein) dehydratase